LYNFFSRIQSFVESSADSSNQFGGYFLAAVNLWTSIFNKQLKEFLGKLFLCQMSLLPQRKKNIVV